MNTRFEKLFCLILLPALAAVGCASATKPTPPPPVPDLNKSHARNDDFDEAMQNWMKSQHIPGMALAIAENGRVTRARAFGLADVANGIPVRTDTAFQIGSISKPILATAVMMLVEEGKLHLDDPLSKYLDGTPQAWKNITIRNLLNHTSGIPDLLNEPLAVNDIHLFGRRIILRYLELDGDRTGQFIFDVLAKQPLNFPPGTRYSYSNSGYVLLTMIIRKITGEPYGSFLHKRIFEPLGMTRTGIWGDIPPLPDSAVGYRWQNDQLIRKWMMPPTIDGKGYGNGGVVSTVLDLAKFDAGLSSGKLVSISTLQQMWTPARLNDGTKLTYGLGFAIGQIPGRRWIWHNGRWAEWGGYTSLFQRFVSEKVTMIILTNQADVDWSSIPQGKIWDQYLPEITRPASQPSENAKQ
ncbi:MAG TPA: serine hydrolase domain-containing protein [Tepidisphaeraceae bacterium]|jgi:CubicO group peptidase (beta-lactamase class C family)|nr:serine hydrolase domain-containing protein [Tepidisphaeraceae bacterium]